MDYIARAREAGILDDLQAGDLDAFVQYLQLSEGVVVTDVTVRPCSP